MMILVLLQEVLAMDYARPSYDMWRLGCLLYQLATAEQLFDITRLQQLRDETQKRQLQRYDDNELLLFAMTDVLGPFPREVCWAWCILREFFAGCVWCWSNACSLFQCRCKSPLGRCLAV